MAIICLPLLVVLAYRPYLQNSWFVDSLNQLSFSDDLLVLSKLSRLMALISLGGLIPLHQWISVKRLDLSSVAGVLLFCLFPFFDSLVHFGFGAPLILISISFWSLIAVIRLLSEKNIIKLGSILFLSSLILVWVMKLNLYSFLFLNAGWSLFFFLQSTIQLDVDKRRNYIILFLLIMAEMVSLQLRQFQLGKTQNWTQHVISNVPNKTQFIQTLVIRDLSELNEYPEKLVLSKGPRADLLKSAHEFLKPEGKMVLKEKMEYFAASAHLHLSTMKDKEHEKWFWLYLTRTFYSRSLKLDYTDYNRLFVIFYFPLAREFSKYEEFEFFFLKYEEKVNELLTAMKKNSANKDLPFYNFLLKENDRLRDFE